MEKSFPARNKFMKNLPVLCLILSLLLFFGLACNLTGLIPGKTDYFAGDSAQKAAAAIREEIGKPFNVAEVFIDEDEFRVKAQDPDNPNNLDEYKYVGGFVTGPNPLKLDGMNENLEKSSFPFDKINFATVPELAREAVEKAGIENGKIYRMRFQRGFALTETGMGSLGDAYWKIEISGTRENVSATADPQGKLLGVDLSGTRQAADYRLITKAELQKAQDALKNVLGEKAQCMKISIGENGLTSYVLNPQNPKWQDIYRYDINGVTKRNLIGMPATVIPGFNATFSLNDINLPDAAVLIEKARTRVNMPDAALDSVSIAQKKFSFNNKEFRIIWSVNFKKALNEGAVEYDNQGNEILVSQNGETISDKK
jgi:hypothetical protein